MKTEFAPHIRCESKLGEAATSECSQKRLNVFICVDDGLKFCNDSRDEPIVALIGMACDLFAEQTGQPLHIDLLRFNLGGFDLALLLAQL